MTEREIEAVIETVDLWAGYDREPILEGINLRISSGEFVGLIGPNGGGKTTLLRVFLGLLKPSRGTVRILGQEIESVRSQIGYVPQSLDVDLRFPIRARDVVRMGRLGKKRVFQRFTGEDDSAVERAMDQTGAGELGGELFGILSGGQRQRVLIARALAVAPRLLLLDEPTSNVDPGMEGEIYELLAALNKDVTIVLVTHDIGVLSAHVRTVGCLNRTLHYHGDAQMPEGVLEETYGCPVEMIAHGTPHRVLAEHHHHPPDGASFPP